MLNEIDGIATPNAGAAVPNFLPYVDSEPVSAAASRTWADQLSTLTFQAQAEPSDHIGHRCPTNRVVLAVKIRHISPNSGGLDQQTNEKAPDSLRRRFR
jgi:hypothetical protein